MVAFAEAYEERSRSSAEPDVQLLSTGRGFARTSRTPIAFVDLMYTSGGRRSILSQETGEIGYSMLFRRFVCLNQVSLGRDQFHQAPRLVSGGSRWLGNFGGGLTSDEHFTVVLREARFCLRKSPTGHGISSFSMRSTHQQAMLPLESSKGAVDSQIASCAVKVLGPLAFTTVARYGNGGPVVQYCFVGVASDS
jgi:hypothetical protein